MVEQIYTRSHPTYDQPLPCRLSQPYRVAPFGRSEYASSSSHHLSPGNPLERERHEIPSYLQQQRLFGS